VFDTSADYLLNNMPDWVRKLSDVLPSFELAGSVYVVGGIVRDALLQQKSRDVDLLVEGFAARELAEKLGPFLQEYFEGEVEVPFDIHCHDEFGTCTVSIVDIVVDVVRARAEHYPHPAALPVVSFADLKTDLERRDFTINALALELYPNKGTFHDHFSGLADLEKKLLRIFHDKSFIDDPTRIIRGARLAGLLGLTFEEETKALLQTGLTPEVLYQISPLRLKAELELCLSESQVLPSIKKLSEMGALETLFSLNDNSSFKLIAALDVKRQTQSVDDDSYLLALFLALSDSELKKIIETYGWSKHYIRLQALLKEIWQSNSLTDTFLKKVNDELYGLKNQAVTVLLQVMSEAIDKQVKHLQDAELRPKITGQDVLDLVSLQGSSGAFEKRASHVGDVLLAVGWARAAGEVLNYEQEIDYATKYIQKKNSNSRGDQ